MQAHGLSKARWRAVIQLGLAAILCALPLSVRAEEPAHEDKEKDLSHLTLERIFQSEDFNGKGFSAAWLKDGSGYVTLEKSEGSSGGRDLVRHDPESGEKTILVPAAHLIPSRESAPLSVDDYAWSEDMSKMLIFTNTKRVWRDHTRGDYWVLDRTSRELTKLGGDAPSSSLMFAKFAPDGEHVAYVREGNIYVEELHTHHITALTEAPSPKIINGTFDWVYEEELSLQDGFRWSPDSRSIAYWQLDTEGEREYPLVNLTDALYPTVQWIQYPKAGEQNAAGRVGVVSVEGGPTRWIDVPGDPREHYIHYLEWPKGWAAPVLQQLNRLQNTNRVLRVKPGTEAVEEILIDWDRAWLDFQNDFRWLADRKEFIVASERDGWRHLYLCAPDGQRRRQVTEGEFDVVKLGHVDEKDGWAYFMASPDNPTQRYLYRVGLNGRHLKRLTPDDQPGTHGYEISPDGRYAIHTYSRADQPPVKDLVSLPDHERVRMLAENTKLKETLGKLEFAPTEFFRVAIDDGVALDASCVRPAKLDPDKKYPLLIYVYGEPWGQTVLDQWGGKSALWHRLLAQQGYVVMSFDNRGTPAPRGRDWRKSIYRQVGILAVEDQAKALRRVLEDRPYLDATRVGIWGWSGGGSMTLGCLFKHPDLYQTGIAIASVPNQRFYDTIYQERYMGLPKDNVEGYRDGSAINFADRLQGDLLLIHGTGDDNVHYQGAAALINELVRHKKQFTMMAYPNRSHGMSEGANTTLHLRELMTSYLHEHLPPGPRDP